MTISSIPPSTQSGVLALLAKTQSKYSTDLPLWAGIIPASNLYGDVVHNNMPITAASNGQASKYVAKASLTGRALMQSVTDVCVAGTTTMVPQWIQSLTIPGGLLSGKDRVTINFGLGSSGVFTTNKINMYFGLGTAPGDITVTPYTTTTPGTTISVTAGSNVVTGTNFNNITAAGWAITINGVAYTVLSVPPNGGGTTLLLTTNAAAAYSGTSWSTKGASSAAQWGATALTTVSANNTFTLQCDTANTLTLISSTGVSWVVSSGVNGKRINMMRDFDILIGVQFTSAFNSSRVVTPTYINAQLQQCVQVLDETAQLSSPVIPNIICRSPSYQPFLDTAIWNSPLGNNAVYMTASNDIPTSMVQSLSVGGNTNALSLFLNQGYYVYQLNNTDPICTVTVSTSTVRPGTMWPFPTNGTGSGVSFKMRLPNYALATYQASDNLVTFMTPDGRYMIEGGSYSFTAGTGGATGTHHFNVFGASDLYGYGVSWPAGYGWSDPTLSSQFSDYYRASGFPTYAGVVRGYDFGSSLTFGSPGLAVGATSGTLTNTNLNTLNFGVGSLVTNFAGGAGFPQGTLVTAFTRATGAITFSNPVAGPAGTFVTSVQTGYMQHAVSMQLSSAQLRAGVFAEVGTPAGTSTLVVKSVVASIVQDYSSLLTCAFTSTFVTTTLTVTAMATNSQPIVIGQTLIIGGTIVAGITVTAQLTCAAGSPPGTLGTYTISGTPASNPTGCAIAMYDLTNSQSLHSLGATYSAPNTTITLYETLTGNATYIYTGGASNSASLQHVWPSTDCDSASNSPATQNGVYTGYITYGSQFALPPSMNLATQPILTTGASPVSIYITGTINGNTLTITGTNADSNTAYVPQAIGQAILSGAAAGTMIVGAQYDSTSLGTGCTCTNGSPIVTGTGGTNFITSFPSGSLIMIGGVIYTVLSVQSNTQLTLTTNMTSFGNLYPGAPFCSPIWTVSINQNISTATNFVLGLPPAGMCLALAYQQYGAYISDSTGWNSPGGTVLLANLESTVTLAQKLQCRTVMGTIVGNLSRIANTTQTVAINAGTAPQGGGGDAYPRPPTLLPL